MVKEKPDKFLVLGDTNSSLAAIMAKRLSIPVYHMEAGNRCYDDRVPEEVNRRLIDHCSDILLPYTERSRQNLLREGIPNRRIYVTGNPIKEVLDFFQSPIDSSNILETLKIKEKKYFLVTLHRAENVDIEARLQKYLQAFADLWRKYQYPVICSLHPRTKARLKIFGKSMKSDGVIPLDPLGLFEFVHLEKNALCVLSDSGTVQEECCIFKIPSITLRDVTERPETLEVGSNILSGADPAAILNCMATVLSRDPHWTPPPEYMAENVSDIVIRILGGFLYQNPLRDG
jgi:UDP-N-acetylglucosamine 2-epimerase (non-hydrolysing)